MIKKSVATAIASLALSVFVTGSAQAAMIAGWDFSQYVGDNLGSIDGVSFTNVLGANYSNLDPTFGAGAESAVFGTLYYDGQFGSTVVDPTSATAQLTPFLGSLNSNINAPILPTGTGAVPFDSFTVLADEGQVFQNALSLKVASAANFVFAAYTTTIPGLGSDWSVSFGGQTSSGTSVVLIDFSTDGTNFTNVGSRTLTSVDTLFTVSLGALASENAFVRLTVDPTGADTRFDNVAINGNVVVPEPTTIVMLGTALAIAAALGRRRA